MGVNEILREMSEDILSLLIKAVEHKLSSKEEDRLQDWLNHEESNIKLYRHVCAFFSEKSMSTENMEERKEIVRKVIMDRIVQMEEKKVVLPKAVGRRMWAIYSGVAAAVVLILVFGATLFLRHNTDVAVTYTEVYAPLGKKLMIVLPDSTVVNLNSGTHLKYASDFNISNRVVKVDGEAYFQVRKQNGREFQVETEAMKIIVRGTVFNVRSYRDDNEVIAWLYEGVVDLNLTMIEKEFTMSVGDKVIYDVEKKNYRIEKCDDEGCDWLNGKYTFDNERLGTLVNMLNRVFDADICFRNKALKDESYTGTIFEGKGLDRILHLLEVSADIRVERDSSRIYLNK